MQVINHQITPNYNHSTRINTLHTRLSISGDPPAFLCCTWFPQAFPSLGRLEMEGEGLGTGQHLLRAGAGGEDSGVSSARSTATVSWGERGEEEEDGEEETIVL